MTEWSHQDIKTLFVPRGWGTLSDLFTSIPPDTKMYYCLNRIC